MGMCGTLRAIPWLSKGGRGKKGLFSIAGMIDIDVRVTSLIFISDMLFPEDRQDFIAGYK